MSLEGLGERVGIVENTLENHERRIQKQESNNELLVEMRTILKMQVETNEKQANQMDKFSETLTKVNDNLTSLNNSQEQLKNEMGKIGQRVSHIEKSQDDNKIDPNKLIKNIILTVITGIAVYLIYKSFGIS